MRFFSWKEVHHTAGAHGADGELVALFIFASSPSPVCLPLAFREANGCYWVLSIRENWLACTLMILKFNMLQVKFWTLWGVLCFSNQRPWAFRKPVEIVGLVPVAFMFGPQGVPFLFLPILLNFFPLAEVPCLWLKWKKQRKILYPVGSAFLLK